jgi:hypothetical protein
MASVLPGTLKIVTLRLVVESKRSQAHTALMLAVLLLSHHPRAPLALSAAEVENDFEDSQPPGFDELLSLVRLLGHGAHDHESVASNSEPSDHHSEGEEWIACAVSQVDGFEARAHSPLFFAAAHHLTAQMRGRSACAVLSRMMAKSCMLCYGF